MLQHPLRLKHPDVLRNVTELRNDRILNRYKIMKKSGKSGGKGIIPLPPGRFFLLTLLFTLLAAAGVPGPEPARKHQCKSNHNQRVIHPHRETGRLYLRLQQCRHRPQAHRDRARQGASHRIHRPRMPARSQRAGIQQQGDPDGRRSDQSSMPMHKLTGTVTDENGAPVTAPR